MVASEGAAVFVLERLDRALARGARVLAVVAGGGSAGDAHHVAAPHPDGRGAASAMGRALADAGMAPEEIDALVAHATATLQGDVAEARALRTVFGPAPGWPSPPPSPPSATAWGRPGPSGSWSPSSPSTTGCSRPRGGSTPTTSTPSASSTT